MREMTFRQVKRLVEYDFLRTEEIMANPAFLGEFVNIVGAFDWSTAAKFNLHMQSEGFPLFPFWVLSGAVLRASRGYHCQKCTLEVKYGDFGTIPYFSPSKQTSRKQAPVKTGYLVTGAHDTKKQRGGESAQKVKSVEVRIVPKSP